MFKTGLSFIIGPGPGGRVERALVKYATGRRFDSELPKNNFLASSLSFYSFTLHSLPIAYSLRAGCCEVPGPGLWTRVGKQRIHDVYVL